jgi:hypothetical protein
MSLASSGGLDTDDPAAGLADCPECGGVYDRRSGRWVTGGYVRLPDRVKTVAVAPGKPARTVRYVWVRPCSSCNYMVLEALRGARKAKTKPAKDAGPPPLRRLGAAAGSTRREIAKGRLQATPHGHGGT